MGLADRISRIYGIPRNAVYGDYQHVVPRRFAVGLFQLFKAVRGYAVFAMVGEYYDRRDQLLRAHDRVYSHGQLCFIKAAVSLA